MSTPIDKVTSQGFDMQFGTNVLGMNRGSFHILIEHLVLKQGTLQVTFISPSYSSPFSRQPQRSHLLELYELSM